MNIKTTSTLPDTNFSPTALNRISEGVKTSPETNLSPTASTRMFRVIPTDYPVASTQLIKFSKTAQGQQPIESSTKPHESLDSLYSIKEGGIHQAIKSMFWKAKEEVFEDGMESEFSRQLNTVVKKHGNDAIEAITCLIVYQKVNPEVAGEALRWLGRLEDRKTYGNRRWLLECSLSLPSTRVRDGAILGLASLDDKHAIKYLKDAIKKESCPELKVDMKQVIEQLES